MAEAFGIAAGALSIAALFNNVVDTFGYIQLGRHFESDFTNCQLKLEVARVRLGRWGEATKINEDPRFTDNAPPTDWQTPVVRAMLSQIDAVFTELRGSSKRYMEAHPTNDPDRAVCDAAVNINKPGDRVLTVFRRIAKRRERKGPGWVDKTYWAIYDAKNFDKLITTVSQLVDSLYQIAPPPPPTPSAPGQPAPPVVEWEFEELDDYAPSLKLLEEASADIDTVLHDTAAQKLRALSYSHNSAGNLDLTDNADARLGDDWTATAITAAGGAFKLGSTRNEAGDVKMAGKAKLHIGTSYN